MATERQQATEVVLGKLRAGKFGTPAQDDLVRAITWLRETMPNSEWALGVADAYEQWVDEQGEPTTKC